MTKAVWGGVLTAAAVLVFSGQAFAQAANDTASVSVSATVNPKAKLTLGSTTASFADADPETVLLLSSTPITVDVKSRTAANGSVTLTVLAGGDLVNAASDAIAINQLTWTVSGALTAGTMSKTAAQSLGTWVGGGTQTGSQTYKLVNSWNYKTGTYGATITYTLTAP